MREVIAWLVEQELLVASFMTMLVAVFVYVRAYFTRKADELSAFRAGEERKEAQLRGEQVDETGKYLVENRKKGRANGKDPP